MQHILWFTVARAYNILARARREKTAHARKIHGHVPANFGLDVIMVLEVDALAHRHLSVGEARLEF